MVIVRVWMNFNEFALKISSPPSLSAVTWITKALLQNNFHHFFGTGDSFDDLAR
jgi:hypothetical protein